jgi:hypothetical protein
MLHSSQRARRYSRFSTFASALAFDQNIGDWDTGNVVNMAGQYNLKALTIRIESALIQRLK